MNFVKILLYFILAIVSGFSFVFYVTYGIYYAPDGNEIIIRSILFFVPIFAMIPVSLRFSEGRETPVIVDRSNPKIPCLNAECEISFAYSEAAWMLSKSQPDPLHREMIAVCPKCGEPSDLLPRIKVPIKKFERTIPPEEMLEDIGA